MKAWRKWKSEKYSLVWRRWKISEKNFPHSSLIEVSLKRRKVTLSSFKMRLALGQLKSQWGRERASRFANGREKNVYLTSRFSPSAFLTFDVFTRPRGDLFSRHSIVSRSINLSTGRVRSRGFDFHSWNFLLTLFIFFCGQINCLFPLFFLTLSRLVCMWPRRLETHAMTRSRRKCQ